MRRAFLALALLALAGCGGGSPTAAKPDPARAAVRQALGAGAHLRAVGGGWKVAWTDAGKAVAVHGDAIVRGPIRLEPLGPKPGGTASSVTQVAAQVTARSRILDSMLLVDGRSLAVKGGGLSPRKITVYAASPRLRKGTHVAIAFARAGRTGRAVGWTFTVR